MTLETVRGVLGWCSVLNIVLLLWWWLFITFAHDWMYRLHRRWFKFPVETFDAIQYAGMAFHKIALLVFNLIPYLALRIVG